MVLVVLVVLERELQVVNGGSRATSGRRIRPGAARMKTVGAQQAAELSAELGEVQRQHGLVGWARRRGKWVDGDEDGEGQALCAWLRVAVGRCVACGVCGARRSRSASRRWEPWAACMAGVGCVAWGWWAQAPARPRGSGAAALGLVGRS